MATEGKGRRKREKRLDSFTLAQKRIKREEGGTRDGLALTKRKNGKIERKGRREEIMLEAFPFPFFRQKKRSRGEGERGERR